MEKRLMQNFSSQAGADGVSSIIGLTGAIPILLGDNIGTTITALIASVGQSKDAKRTAVAHSVFNISGALIFIWLIKPFSALVQYISPSGTEVAVISRQIANAHFSEKMIRRIQTSKTKQGQTRERFLYNYLTGIISRDLEVLGRYERVVMNIEEEISLDRFDEYIREIPKMRKNLLILREYYDEIRDLGKELEEDENHFFSKKYLKYFGTVSDRADRLMNRTQHLFDYISQVRDTYLQKVSDQQNKNMQFLTVISTIFFPLTLITGWFGMNFKNMPELERGYPFVIVFSLMVVGFIIWLFKKRKII